jgi:putative tricarboxylic transport membrane protein
VQTERTGKISAGRCAWSDQLPEGSNNAKEGGDYIPTLAFGIPGGTSSALVPAFIAVGIKLGPDMLTSQLNLTFAVI